MPMNTKSEHSGLKLDVIMVWQTFLYSIKSSVMETKAARRVETTLWLVWTRFKKRNWMKLLCQLVKILITSTTPQVCHLQFSHLLNFQRSVKDENWPRWVCEMIRKLCLFLHFSCINRWFNNQFDQYALKRPFHKTPFVYNSHVEADWVFLYVTSLNEFIYRCYGANRLPLGKASKCSRLLNRQSKVLFNLFHYFTDMHCFQPAITMHLFCLFVSLLYFSLNTCAF